MYSIEILNQIQAAMNFIGQAQELAPNSSDLWKELGSIFDTIDELQDSLQSNDYNEVGEFIG